VLEIIDTCVAHRHAALKQQRQRTALTLITTIDHLPMRILLASAFLCLPFLAHADCKERFTEWTHALQPGRAVDADNAVCKVWPANPTQTLAVLPLPQKGGTTDETVYDVEVLVADSKTGAIIAHTYEPSAITSDAMSLESLALDTAPWRLTPQELAFGVRKSFQNSSQVDPYANTALSLYVIDGSKLRRVLSNLTTRQSKGDWDGNCAGQFSDTSRAISVGPAGRGGYATLLIREKTIDTTKTVAGTQCASKGMAAKRASFTLGYDGSRYGVPAGLSDDQ
jgi:hypothetical protein